MRVFLSLAFMASTSLADEETIVTGTVATEFRERAKHVPGLRDDKACVCLHAEPPRVDDLLVSASGQVKNALVRVTKGVEEKDRPAPREPVILNQKGCVYTPRVVALRAGQPLEFRSDDNMLHNVHGLTFEN